MPDKSNSQISYNNITNNISPHNNTPGYAMPSPTQSNSVTLHINMNQSYNNQLLQPEISHNPDVSIYDNSESYDLSMAEKSRFDINPNGPSNGIKIPMPLPVINVNEVPMPSYTSSPLIIQAQQRNHQIWQNYQQIQNNGIPVSSALTLSLLRLMTENLTVARKNSSTITEKKLNERKESQFTIFEIANLPINDEIPQQHKKHEEAEEAEKIEVLEYLEDTSIMNDDMPQGKIESNGEEEFISKVSSIKKSGSKLLIIDGLIKELYDTECSYIDNLNVMVDIIKARLLKKNIIPVKAVEVIFFGLMEIRDFSIKLRDSIHEASATSIDNKVNAISEVFLRYVGDFNCYVNFVSNYSKASITIKSYEKSSTLFAEFLHSIPKMEECKRQDINSFFIMPIQHAMRYSLLLSELNKKNPENEGLEAAMNFMKEMAETLNQVKRQEEEINGVYTIFNETLYCPRILIKNSESEPKRLIETYHGIIFRRTSASIHVMNDSVLITKNRKANIKYKYKFQFFIEYSSIVVRKSNKSDTNLAFFIKNNNPNNFVSKSSNLLAKTSQRITNLHLKKGVKGEALVCIVKLNSSKDADELLNLIKELSEKFVNEGEEKNRSNSQQLQEVSYFNETSSMFNNSMENSTTFDQSSILNSSRSTHSTQSRSISDRLYDHSFDPSKSYDMEDEEEEYDENDYY